MACSQPVKAPFQNLLEIECPSCEGRKGFDSFKGNRGGCSTCYGSGMVPTELGKAVLDLMRHNAPIVAEELEEMGAR